MVFIGMRLQLSYLCMPNMKFIISSHNKHALSSFNSPPLQPDTSNCRKKPRQSTRCCCYWIYQATVTTATTTETYVGLATNFKEHYRNHQKWNRTLKICLDLTIKDTKKPFQIKWKVLKKCKPYNNRSKKCNFSLYEKFIIICKKQSCSLNRLNELASSCPHRNKYVFRSFRVT